MAETLADDINFARVATARMDVIIESKREAIKEEEERLNQMKGELQALIDQKATIMKQMDKIILLSLALEQAKKEQRK